MSREYWTVADFGTSCVVDVGTTDHYSDPLLNTYLERSPVMLENVATLKRLIALNGRFDPEFVRHNASTETLQRMALWIVCNALFDAAIDDEMAPMAYFPFDRIE